MKITPTNIQDILNAADVEGLLHLGAPNDEYASEAQMISQAIVPFDESELTQERLEAIVRNVWTNMFGPFPEKEVNKRGRAFSDVARQILSLPKKQHRSQ